MRTLISIILVSLLFAIIACTARAQTPTTPAEALKATRRHVFRRASFPFYERAYFGRARHHGH
jgi:hypothetical protein